MAEPTESSPLLVAENNDVEANAGDRNLTSFPEISTYTATRDFFPGPINILTKCILVTSIAAFAILLAADILISNAPFSWVSLTTDATVKALGGLVLVAFIAAVINLRVKLLILFNFLIDIFLILEILSWVSEIFSYNGFPDDDWCHSKWSPGEPSTGCLNWVQPAKILIGLGAGFASTIGVLHLVLFILRCVAAWKSKFWRRPAGFSVPTGELTFQFTIRFLKQESPSVVHGDNAVSRSPST